MSISGNIGEIRARIAAAAEKAGRSPDEIMLVAATKMNDSAAVREAVSGGVDACGENRVVTAKKKQTGIFEYKKRRNRQLLYEYFF